MSEHDSDSYVDIDVAIYGGGKGNIVESIETHFGLELTKEAERKWVGPHAAKRVMGVTTRGVSEIGYADASGECALLSLIVAFFLFLIVIWQLVMFLIVIVVLAIFSGGAALKYTRATYMTTDSASIEPSQLEAFTKDMIDDGRFVMVGLEEAGFALGPVAKASTRATRLFRYGIVFSMLIASLFLVTEVIYRLLYSVWLVDLLILAGFGFAFLFGIIATDLGVILRRRLRGEIEAGYVDGPLRE
ncbi:MAG: hypothetical protein ACXAEN_23915 [Candidatus Thorarchaeota archaeon]|jgi:hypothetical protein